MTSTPTPTPDPLRTWMEIIALLVEASGRGSHQAFEEPTVHSSAVGAGGAAAEAFALLPGQYIRELDELSLDVSTGVLDMAGLIRAAELASRRHPIEQFPPGASAVIVALCDLVAEVGGQTR